MEHKKKCEIKYNNWVQKKTDKQAELQRKQMEKEKNEKEVEVINILYVNIILQLIKQLFELKYC